MKYSTVVTSLLAVSFATAQGRPHPLYGDIDENRRDGVSFEIKRPVASLDVRGFEFSQSATNNCTDSSSVPSTTSTVESVPKTSSSTEDCAETSFLPSTSSTAQGIATLPYSTKDCTDLSTLSSITSTAQGTATLSSSTENRTETSSIPSSTTTTRISLSLKTPFATSTAEGAFTVLSSKSSSIALVSGSTFPTTPLFGSSSTTANLLTAGALTGSTGLSESNVASTSTTLSSSTIRVTTTVTAALFASTSLSLLTITIIPPLTSNISPSRTQGSGTVISSALSSILAVSTGFQLTTSTLILTSSIPEAQSQSSDSSNRFASTVATVTYFTTLADTSTTITSTVTLATPAGGISVPTLNNPSTSAQVLSSVSLPSTASSLSSIPRIPSSVSIETTDVLGRSRTFSFTQPTATSAAPTLATTSPAYTASSSLPAAGICACTPITVTITTMPTISTPPTCPCSSSQTFLVPGSKPPASSSKTANTVALSTSALGPYSYCTSTASLHGLVGLQLNCSSWTISFVTPPSSTIVPASAVASSTRVPEMPWMGNYSSAPAPTSIMSSSFAIMPLGNPTGSATQPSPTGGCAQKGFKHTVSFLVSFLALVVLF